MVFQSSLEDSLLILVSPASLCIQEVDWWWNPIQSNLNVTTDWKHSLLEIGKMDELNIRNAVAQLYFKVKTYQK